MRNGILSFMLLGLAGVAIAHPSIVPTTTPTDTPSTVTSPTPATSAPTVAETILTPSVAVGQQHTIGVQLQFGQPTGLRVQYTAFQIGDFSLLVEAFGGARSSFWGEETVLGVGGRALFTLLSDGENDALLVGPGVGISYWQAPEHVSQYWDPYSYYPQPRGQTDRYFLNLDANVGWLHDLSPALGWELGINFGVRVGISGREENGKEVSGRIIGGTIGIYTGLRF